MNEKKLSRVDAAIAAVHLREVIAAQMNTAASYRDWAREHRLAGEHDRAAAYVSLAMGTERDVEALQRVLEFLE